MANPEWDEDSYNQRLEADRKAAAIAPRAGGEDFRGNTFDAFASSMGDTATIGLLDEIRAGVRTPPGADYIERYMSQLDIESDRGDELARQNPKANITGGLLGAIMGGGGANLGIKAALQTTARGRQFFKGVDSIIKRLGVGAVAGATEGGAYAFNENLSMPLGVGIGTLFGLGGQAVLGEAVPGVWRAVKGKPTVMDGHVAKEQIVKLLMSKHSDLSVDDAEAAFDIFRDSLKKLGPEATLADISEEVRATALGIVGDPGTIKAGQAFMNSMSARMRSSGGRMKQSIARVLGSDEALSPTQVKNQAAQDFKTYSPEFERVLNDSDALFPAVATAKMIEDGFTSGGITTNEANSAYKAMMKFLKRHAQLDDDGNIVGAIGATEMNGLVKQLDALYNSQTDPFAPATDKILRKQIAALRSNIKGHLNQVPGYQAINALYSQTTNVANAHEIGTKLVTKEVQDWSALESLMEEISSDGMIAMMDGVKWSLVSTITKEGDNAAAKLLNDGVLREKLVKAFGATTTDELINSARSAARLSDTEALMDSARGAGLTGLEKNPITAATDIGIAGAGLASPYVSSAAGIGALRRTAADLHGAKARQNTAYSELVGRSGPEAEALLNDTLPQVQAGPRPTDPSDLASSGLGVFGVSALPGERKTGPQ